MPSKLNIEERHAVVCTVVFSVLILGLITSIVVLMLWPPIPRTAACDTPECRAAKSYLGNLLNNSVEPCKDFYGYVCGSWKKNGRGFLGDLKKTLFSRLNASLFRDGPHDKYGTHALRALYKSCHSSLAVDISTGSILEATTNLLNISGLLKAKNDRDVHEFLIRTSLTTGFHTLFSLTFVSERNNARLHMSSGTSLMDNFNTTKRTELALYVADILQYMPGLSNTTESLTAILDIDSQVDSNLHRAPAKDRYDVFTVLEKMYEHIPTAQWLDLVNRIVPKEIRVTADQTIKITGQELITAAVNATSYTPVARFALYLAIHLTSRLVILEQAKRKSRTSPQEAARFCLHTTRHGFTHTWPYLIANILSPSVTRQHVVKIYDTLRDKKNLDSVLVWMQGSAHEEAHDKIKTTTLVAIDRNPSDDLDQMKFADFNVEDVPSRLFTTNYLKFVIHDHKQRLKKIPTPLLFHTADMQETSNLSLSEKHHAIVVPTLHQVKPLFYPVGVPIYFNYGTLGALLAVQVSESLGPRGSQYDASGKLRTWWSGKTEKAFNSIVTCLVDLNRRMNPRVNELGDKRLNAIFVWAQSARLAYNSLRAEFLASTSQAIFDEHWSEAQKTYFLRFCLLSCERDNAPNPLLPRETCMLPLHNMQEFADAFGCRQIPGFVRGNCSFDVVQLTA